MVKDEVTSKHAGARKFGVSPKTIRSRQTRMPGDEVLDKPGRPQASRQGTRKTSLRQPAVARHAPVNDRRASIAPSA